MPEKRRGLPNWVFLLIGATFFAGYLFIRYMGQRTVLKAVLGEPAEVVDKAMNSAAASPRITARIGEVHTRTFKLEKFNTQKDTLAVRFLVQGERAEATIKLWMVKRPSGQWHIVKSDTLFSKGETARASK